MSPTPPEPSENSSQRALLEEQKLLRCEDWLQKQNSQEPKKSSLQNKNDIQFIIQTNTERKNFLMKVADDDATVPAGINELNIEPKNVPLKKLRVDSLQLECGWKDCRWFYPDYEDFQKHCKEHISELEVTEKDGQSEYACLWDVCGHKTMDFDEMVRHINYHAYHCKLLAIGFNGRATLKLMRCQRDSSKRNQLPALSSDHFCQWTGCDKQFNAIQGLFDHVKVHIYYSERRSRNKRKFLCSWAGCGAVFPRRTVLTMHVRSHTCERLIACYHCGMHFSNNRKLADHLRRQNVYPTSSHVCTVCGVLCSTEYLLREHARQHISAYLCSVCDMSAPTRASLAQHMRYRHLPDNRPHACPHCDYRAVTKSDLRKHIPTHTRKRKRKSDSKDEDSEKSNSDDESDKEQKKKKSSKKYACHMCPENKLRVFSRGTRLTSHLVKVHGAQWPFGHSRFRYQISDDGMYRLTTTRYEFLDVSKKIVDGSSLEKESLNKSFEYNLELRSEPTETTPRQFAINLKNQNGETGDNDSEVNSDRVVNDIEKHVEITMCDVDEHGNIIKEKTICSEVIS